MILISGDKNVFKDGWNGCGIYRASGVFPSPSFDPPIYIGSARDLRKRIFYKHLPELECGEHHNAPMRNYFMKNGGDSLAWELLETCEENDLISREQFYLDLYQPFAKNGKGFNVLENAGSSLGNKWSEEVKAKMSKSHLEKSKNLTKIWFTVISPSGEEISGEDLRDFCEKNGLSLDNMKRTFRGTQEKHLGYRVTKMLDIRGKSYSN